MPDKKERILDSGDKETNILESEVNFAISYLKIGQYKEATQLFQQILKTHEQLLDDGHHDTLVLRNFAIFATKLGWYQEANDYICRR